MKNLLFSLFLFSYFLINAQINVLNVDFNNGIPTGWEIIDNDNLTPFNNSNVNFMTEAWNLIEDYDSLSIGDSILVATSWFEETGAADNYLISPLITLGNYGNYISFDLKSIDASNPDGFQVLFSTGGNSINDFVNNPLIFDAVAISPYWTNYSVNLDDLGINDQSVHFAFRHYANDKYILALDNISLVINDPVNITENNIETFAFYPNPTRGTLNLLNVPNQSKIKITDLNGKLILNTFNDANKLHLNLEQGVYLMEVNNSIKKLVIK